MNASKERMLTALKILEAIRDTIYDCGEEGCPGGVLYTALQERGCSYSAFESMMGILLESGCVRVSNHVYYKARVQ